MIRIIKVLLAIAGIGLAALTGYAFVGDLRPDRQPVEVPVTLTPE